MTVVTILQKLNLIDENNDCAGNVSQKRKKSHLLDLLLQ